MVERINMVYSLIDADSVYFTAAYVTQKHNEIKKIIKNRMLEIEREVMSQAFEDVETRVAVKGFGNFRKDLYPKYKMNRKDLDPGIKKAVAYGWEYMIDQYDGVKADGMEADDLVAIWAHEARAEEEQYVVVGIDKDLLQIPGNHYNFKKKEHQFVDDSTGNLHLMRQCLTGDTTDNIPGIKGIGAVKAAKILDGVGENDRWHRVRSTWHTHNAGDPQLSWRLLKMLYDWKEYEDIRTQISSETPISEHDDGSEKDV